MKETQSKVEQKKVVYGRPRLLTHDEIIEAALHMGLENITMKKLATHLNVGTATLYQYWDNRKTLMQAAAVRALSHVALPDDEGQHWSEYAYAFTQAIKNYLAHSPSLVLTNPVREYGYEVQFNLAEKFLSVMHIRGFEPGAAMEIFNMVGSVAFAGAVEEIRQNEFMSDHETAAEAAKRQFARLDSTKFPLFSQAVEALTQPPEARMTLLLRAAFQTIARQRGEAEDGILVNQE